MPIGARGVPRRRSPKLYCSKGLENSIRVANEWVSNLEVSNYGVFEKAEMKLSGRPSFVVITGETGAGKSVLVSALEYALSGSNKRNLLLKTSGAADVKDDTSSAKESFVSLCLADHEQKKLLGIKRSRSLSGKRSTCQVNGEKITSKALSEQLGGIVKFWTAETSCLVDTGSKASSSGAEGNSFLAHVDNNLDEKGHEVLQKLPEAYAEWRKAYLERSRLERLQESADNGNDASLLEFYIEEVDNLEGAVVEVFTDLLKVLEEYEEVALDGAPPSPFLGGEGDEDEDEDDGERGSSTKALIELVSKVLDGSNIKRGDEDEDEGEEGERGYNYAGSSPRVDLQGAWNALRQAEDWAKTLQTAMEHSFPDDSGSGGGGAADSFMAGLGRGSGGGRGAGAGVDIRDVEAAIEDYVDRLITLQEALREVGLGVVDAGIDSRIEETHVALQASLRSVKTATGMLGDLRDAMPGLEGTVEGVTALRIQWETIRRKHGPGKGGMKRGGDLAALRKQWGKDVGSLASLESALPLAVAQEQRASQAYAALAQQMSTARTHAVEELLGRVNSLLPSLEMSGVRVSSTVQSAAAGGDGDQQQRPEVLSPLLQTVRSDGWDTVSLQASHTHTGSFEGVASTRSASTLSSGENARLALAIESCAVSGSALHTASDRAATTSSSSGLETMIVYDEIDAHVGGEAAVAVARLLRQQGSKRQVVAITHNPVIAAAADQHFVVNREQAPRRGSHVTEVEGTERESELTRMTTGNLDTSAGLELAKALLKEFQPQKQ